MSLISPPLNTERYLKGHPLTKNPSVVEPLGLAYLAAMIEDITEVDIVDCVAEWLSPDECVYRVKDSDIIGISSVMSNSHIALDLAERAKAASEAMVVFGGIDPSVFPSKILKNKQVDVVVIGEGEYTFREIVLGRPFGEILGIAYRENGEIIINPPRPQEMDLDNFPFPARHLLCMERYNPFVYLRKPVHGIFSSRGCPFKCAFCCRDISGQVYRLRKPEKVVEEIKELCEKWGAKELYFLDPIFGLNKAWLKEFCTLLIEENLDLLWSAQSRVDIVDRNLIRLMKKAGCWMLYYGIEAGTRCLLETNKKNTTLTLIRKSVRFTAKAGIRVWGSFMFALAGETPDLAKETLTFAKSLSLDFASFHLTTPFPNTELWDNVETWGTMSNEWSKFTQGHPVFIPYGWEGHEEELKEMIPKAFREFYLRPSYILRQLLKVRSFRDIALYYRGLRGLS